MNSSIPGYSESLPCVGGNGKANGRRGIHPTTQAPSAASHEVDSVDSAVDALSKLHIRETTTATGASKTRQIGEDSKKVSRGRGAGSFKYQPSSTTANNAEHRPSSSTSTFTGNSTNQRAGPQPLRPPMKSLSTNEEDKDDSPPPGFPDPWED
jgi:hypothetical protein